MTEPRPALATAPRDLWFTSHGTTLFAADEGAGDTIVMLHGGMANHQAVLRYVQPLADRYRVITPDIRGNGRSWYSGAITFDQLADDVVALLDAIGVDRAAVGGVSGGSGVAIRAALRHPTRVSHLVIAQPVYAGADRGYTDAQRNTFAMMDAVASRAVVDGIDVLRPLYQNLPDAIRERALAMMSTFDPASVVSTSRFIASGAQPFSTASDLGALSTPTLLVRGSDPLHPAEVSDLYVEHLRRCTAVASSADMPTAIADLLSASPEQFL